MERGPSRTRDNANSIPAGLLVTGSPGVITMKQFLHFAALALALAAGQAGAQPFQVQVPANVEPADSGLTRAEVIADYQMWRLAGLQDLTRGEQSVDTSSYQYRKAFATYRHLCQSPQFAQLVSELQKNPKPRVAASPVADSTAHASN
jgi:hypothetical protein